MDDEGIEPLICGKTCFRLIERHNRPVYERYVCYAGEGGGATVCPNAPCFWGYTTRTPIDRNEPSSRSTSSELEQSQPKCTTWAEDRFKIMDAAARSRDLHKNDGSLLAIKDTLVHKTRVKG